MAPSQFSALYLGAHAFAAIATGFGVNAILHPTQALTFFGIAKPTASADAIAVDSLMAVYGARDIFMGVAIWAAAFCGTPKSLGWTVLAASGVAAADGLVCYVHTTGHWNHWSYAPVFAVIGLLLLQGQDEHGNTVAKKA
ncbi:hypothetical protein C7999DRAFT_36214 [Corynascus novoguineensis]|uniref:Uncharacterized protein n=1 Tax=Corynascus novoguineensis TaxID=1126955 RepID=A0AAN7HIP8_9PEZI|nr:hypothetical protein C7999DRAFT_36214 [Corynascus novoguineensis]